MKDKTDIYFIKEVNNSFKLLVNKIVSTKGRMSSVRKMKAYIFVDLWDQGSKIQLCFDKDKTYLPLAGDLIQITGKCFYTINGEPSIKVAELQLIAKWKAGVGYKNVTENGPLEAFLPGSYNKLLFVNLVNNKIRTFLESKGFFEILTPVLGKNFNGGKSFPVTTSYLGKQIGYNRTTFEEKMQAVIGAGFNNIFQIGNVFRSNKEYTFLEAYSTNLNYEKGKKLVEDMLSEISKSLCENGLLFENPNILKLLDNKWVEIDYFKEAERLFGISESVLLKYDDNLIRTCIKNKIIENTRTSSETLADRIAKAIAVNMKTIGVIDGYPIWSSPLYKKDADHERLSRSRMFFPGYGLHFDIGMQENDYENFCERVKLQRSRWHLTQDDERTDSSELSILMSGGMPPMFGFGVNLDKFLHFLANE